MYSSRSAVMPQTNTAPTQTHPNKEIKHMPYRIILAGVAAFCLSTTVQADEPVGARPYEMVWANRTLDTRHALVDFEDLQGWTVQCSDAVASFEAPGMASGGLVPGVWNGQPGTAGDTFLAALTQIGRASCRERV